MADHHRTYRHILPHCATLCHIVSHCVTLCHIVLHCVKIVPHCVTLCHIVPHCAPLCHIVSHCATLCLWQNIWSCTGLQNTWTTKVTAKWSLVPLCGSGDSAGPRCCNGTQPRVFVRQAILPVATPTMEGAHLDFAAAGCMCSHCAHYSYGLRTGTGHGSVTSHGHWDRASFHNGFDNCWLLSILFLSLTCSLLELFQIQPERNKATRRWNRVNIHFDVPCLHWGRSYIQQVLRKT